MHTLLGYALLASGVGPLTLTAAAAGTPAGRVPVIEALLAFVAALIVLALICLPSRRTWDGD